MRAHPRPHLGSRPMRRRMSGFSLLELMVGITVGLLVSVAAVGSLVYTQLSGTVSNEVTRMQQDASFALRLLGEHIRSVGAVSLSSSTDGNVGFNLEFTGLNVGASRASGLVESGGVLTVTASRYHKAEQITDCLGNAAGVTASGGVVSVFGLANGSLQCGPSGNEWQPVIERVEEWQLRYAVRDVVNNTVQYRSAADVTTAAAWPNVQAVAVCLRLASAGNQHTNLPATQGCQGQSVAADGRLRRVYRQTFTVRPGS